MHFKCLNACGPSMLCTQLICITSCHSKNSHSKCLQALAGREIAPNTGANATKFFTLATKSCKLVTKLATRMFHHNHAKRYSELKDLQR